MRVGVASLLAAFLLAGCAGPGQHGGGAGERAAFPTDTGFTSTMPVKTDEIADIGLYPLPNHTAYPIRLREVTFAQPPADLHLLNVRAYNYQHTRQGIIGMVGDLAKECPRVFIPRPIDSFVTPPRKSTQWFIVIAFTISRPGRYNLGRIKITYVFRGHTYWQYLRIGYTMTITNPPRPGPRPLPAKQVCGA